MTNVLLHLDVFDDLKLCRKKGWYKSLGQEMPRICRLLNQDGRLPGERSVHYIKLVDMQGKIFHAGINLPNENVGKQKGPRIIYFRETLFLCKVLYIGGHKDKKYDDSYKQVELIENRFGSGDRYVPFTEDLDFEKD